MSEQSGNRDGKASGNEPLHMAGTGAGGGKGGGRGRQGIGEAFFMSMIRQIARSIGTALVRAVIGRRR